jgi:ActR/RegA family two-component response regulator
LSLLPFPLSLLPFPLSLLPFSSLALCCRVRWTRADTEKIKTEVQTAGVESGFLASVLLVDDDVELLQVMSRFLSESGFNVVSSSTFEEAKREIAALRPDIVVTDVRLGAFNGLQLVLMARDVRPDVRLVVFSGFDDPVLKEEARRLGARYLVKPVSGHQLLKELRNDVSG